MEVSDMAKRKITPERVEFRKQLGTLMAGAGIQSMEDIQELFREMIGGFVDQGLEGELDEELGYSKYDYRNKETDNSRNGHSEKTLKTS
jgi:putative transposase